uniref:Uncharacterized protein n=1 Tax=Anopheles braziliensis TaxID=58242 RepID=A0A2M3ZMF7_9DIPT
MLLLFDSTVHYILVPSVYAMEGFLLSIDPGYGDINGVPAFHYYIRKASHSKPFVRIDVDRICCATFEAIY